jgi:hypothetical protein
VSEAAHLDHSVMLRLQFCLSMCARCVCQDGCAPELKCSFSVSVLGRIACSWKQLEK